MSRKATVWSLLATPEPPMPRVDLSSTTQTASDGSIVRLNSIPRPWTDFEEEVKLHIQKHFSKKGPVIDQDDCAWGSKVRYLELSSEAKLDVNLKHIYDKVNTALERTGYNITLQGGKHLKGVDKGIPDLAANLTHDMHIPAPERTNRCPGEIKLSRKWGAEMPPDNSVAERISYMSALSQIHHYMNVHSAKTGYIITDREMVALKRVGHAWGEMEMSDPIPLSPVRKGGTNVKIALWFLLSRYGCDEASWKHPKFDSPKSIRQTIEEAAGAATDTEYDSESSYQDSRETTPGLPTEKTWQHR
jgi:hypothetical protein